MHPRLPYRVGQVHWALQREMARTVDDVLSRRLRALFLDAARNPVRLQIERGLEAVLELTEEAVGVFHDRAFFLSHSLDRYGNF